MFLRDRYSDRWRVKWLEKTIKRLKPDIIHSLEFQHAGYTCLEVKRRMGIDFPTWIATNWGSDIYLYSRLKGHIESIKGILQEADFYSAECSRDYDIAQDLGLKAAPLPVIPNAGGFHLKGLEEARGKLQTSKRKVILIKGYQMVFGRAMTAIKALELIASELKEKDFIVHVAGATEDIQVAIELVSISTGLNIKTSTVHTPLSHEAMLNLHASARIYIGLSISDGISTSMLEAMALGAYPIQTCTSCANEWIEHGKTGFIAQSYDDPQEIAGFIMKAIEDDNLVDHAAEDNWQTISKKACYEDVQRIARGFYDTAYSKRKIS